MIKKVESREPRVDDESENVGFVGKTFGLRMILTKFFAAKEVKSFLYLCRQFGEKSEQKKETMTEARELGANHEKSRDNEYAYSAYHSKSIYTHLKEQERKIWQKIENIISFQYVI